MTAALSKVAPWALAVLLAVGLVVGYSAHEREVGRLQIQLHSADSLAKAAQESLTVAHQRLAIDSGREVALAADTASANQVARSATARLSALDASYSHAKSSLDSLLAQPHDSVSAGLVAQIRGYEQASDSTVKACGQAVKADSVALSACQAHGEALQATLTDTRSLVAALAKDTTAKALTIRGLKAEQPSGLSVWGWRIVYAGLGYLIGRAK